MIIEPKTLVTSATDRADLIFALNVAIEATDKKLKNCKTTRTKDIHETRIARFTDLIAVINSL